ncbi:hypothetical protein GCM10010387_50330 [Streptomyces inusitatus]|uniref:Uncharacterized protein n=1 Tax=Streptomyces inusitatus TaxID=68221 RepID=A0A918QIH8_9ACTN|nr:hypothetical protein GCM10010387_50330 [Streptomyces inusitatus]
MEGVGGADIKDRIVAIPGLRLIKEEPYPGYRFFTFTYEQPMNHRNRTRSRSGRSSLCCTGTPGPIEDTPVRRTGAGA